MKVRMPEMSFAGMPARWMKRNPELSQLLNGFSVGVPNLERFLNKVMARARAELRGDDPATARLREDITTFIRQESCHTAIHVAFNRAIEADGYDRIAQYDAEAAEHYDRLLRTKSLRFLLAYCEGFETIGPPVAKLWIDGQLDDLLVDAHPDAVMLQKWHTMEEFEHRHVVYDVFKTMRGGYFLRIYGYFYQAYYMFKIAGRAYEYLLEVDRAKMTAQEIRESQKRASQANRVLLLPILRGMCKTIMPWYSPRQLPNPERYESLRETIERDWVKAVSPRA